MREIENMSPWQAIVETIKEVDCVFQMTMLAQLIRLIELTEGFDELAQAWGDLQKRMDCADTRDILQVIASKKEANELAQMDALR